MTTLLDQNVGKLVLPKDVDPTRRLFLPGRVTPTTPGYQAIVSISVHSGQTGKKLQAGYAAGIVCRDGLAQRWAENEALQQQFASVEDLMATMTRRLVQVMHGHNERTQNGARMIAKGFFGAAATPNNATVGAPNRIALANVNITSTYTDQVLGQASTASNPNEATTNGMGRTAALTPAALTDATNFDLQYSLTISNVFTDITAASTLYAAALMDAAGTGSPPGGTTFNMFAEAKFTASATLQINDTLNVTWTALF